MAEDIIDIDFTPDWQLAQVKMLEHSQIESLDGITQEDEDYIDYWEAGIPTEIKLRYKLKGRKGEDCTFIDEWDKLNASISANEREVDRRRRILAKRQLLVDLLHAVRAWMTMYIENIPDKEGKLNKPFRKGSNGGQEP